jgi:hypothetical protein
VRPDARAIGASTGEFENIWKRPPISVAPIMLRVFSYGLVAAGVPRETG